MTKKKQHPTNPANAMRLALSDDLRQKLEEMAAADRRKRPDFLRVLLEQEWERRQKAAVTAA